MRSRLVALVACPGRGHRAVFIGYTSCNLFDAMTASSPKAGALGTSYDVRSLGARAFPSPLGLAKAHGTSLPPYVSDDARVLYDIEFAPGKSPDLGLSFEKAGPRETLFFEPSRTRVGIVSCGGICPGINNVIRTIVLQLFYKYGVRDVLGFRYGFAGLDPACAHAPVVLEPELVRHVHKRGGTILGTSRGRRDLGVMLETLARERIDILFAIGGDGTMTGAHALAEEAFRRGMRIAVVGVPKTIDNDIAFADKSFGFDTAVAIASDAISAAHTEALSAEGGIGLVKLMGRGAGFIAAHATLASHEVNVCLVPEIRFDLDGPKGLLAYLERRLETRPHAVIVAAEGCGASLIPDERLAPKDASGNVSFQAPELDIGLHVKHRLETHFAKRRPIVLKYIDPSYMIRGVPAHALDAVFCDDLARAAVHAAMAGKTDVMVGRWHRVFTHVPLPLALSVRKRIDPDRELWLSVLETTGQPSFVNE